MQCYNLTQKIDIICRGLLKMTDIYGDTAYRHHGGGADDPGPPGLT